MLMQKFRIVSLVPSLTELLVDLGLGSQLVGVTKFCVHPKDLKKSVAVVGGTKNPKHELIFQLEPTHIIANIEENNKEDVEAFRKMADVSVHVSEIKNTDDLAALIKTYGVIFSVENQAKQISSKVREVALQFEKEFALKPEISVAYFIWKDPWMSVGNDTFINYMLELCKFKNCTSNQQRYPEVKLNEISNEVVFLSSEPFPFQETHVEFFSHLNSTCFLVDGEFFSWYGSRFLHSFEYLKKLRNAVDMSVFGV